MSAEPTPGPGVESRGQFFETQFERGLALGIAPGVFEGLGARVGCRFASGPQGREITQDRQAFEVDLIDLIEHIVPQSDHEPRLSGKFDLVGLVGKVSQIPGHGERCAEIEAAVSIGVAQKVQIA